MNTIIRSLDSKLVPNTNPKLYVYRGMSKEAYEIYKEQGVIVNKGYLSTSKDLEIAKEFSRQTGVILKFLIPVDFSRISDSILDIFGMYFLKLKFD